MSETAIRTRPVTEGPRISHIDGLRAIAVFAVVAYHAGIPGFASGFVGVDIFFVISGFLIINQIVSELHRGTFSFAVFYARRSIRILPPFFAMLIGSFIIACFVLVPPFEWEWFTLSAVFSSIFLSNVFFMSKQGYFDIGAMQKPLLHTWSLSVEEQFYIWVPILLAMLFWIARKRMSNPTAYLIVGGILAFAGSLAGCILLTSAFGKNPAFFMFIWRGWEFIIGGAMAWVAAWPVMVRNNKLAEYLGLLGLALVILSITSDISDGFFPGYAVIIPVSGSALLLLSGLMSPDTWVARALSIRPMVLVGLISYSWYLWHWPLISFAHLANFSKPSFALEATMAFAALVPAILSYRYLEVPIRNWRHRTDLRALGWRPVKISVMAALASIMLIGGVGGGLFYFTRNAPQFAGDPALIDPPTELCEGGSCVMQDRQAGVLTGDSHADRLMPELAAQAALFGAAVAPPFWAVCISENTDHPWDMGDCDDIRNKINIREQTSGGLDFWIVNRLWTLHILKRAKEVGREDYLNRIRDRLLAYSDGGKRRLLVTGAGPTFDHSIAECLFRAERYGLGWDYCAKPRAEIDQSEGVVNARIKAIVETIPNARFIDPTGLFCDETLCRPYIGRTILFRDHNHLTRFGVKWYYAKLRHHFVWAITGEDRDAGATLP